MFCLALFLGTALSTAIYSPQTFEAIGAVLSRQTQLPIVTYVTCLDDSCSRVYFCWKAQIALRPVNACRGFYNVTSIQDLQNRTASFRQIFRRMVLKTHGLCLDTRNRAWWSSFASMGFEPSDTRLPYVKYSKEGLNRSGVRSSPASVTRETALSKTYPTKASASGCKCSNGC